MNFGIFPPQVMAVIGGGKRNSRFGVQRSQPFIDLALLFQAVVLYFKIIVAFCKQRAIAQRTCFGVFIAPIQQLLLPNSC